ncbi:NUDIX hydrolase [Streptomyces tropicalis]|uniref:NUDIX hydrolase n=1 Tax=Streptomyces tropicalis TaxID=3034234 RepID=A0ABT5ZYT5_9ACTN|nr:NUDIX hydrolase [Streptomyces tropicalis]MDF3297551.1 NUDIX hydrolase [Streptomyces tropicalis]
MRQTLRVAAYAVCVRDGRLLLARGRDGHGDPEWTLPGGGMEHGEDPHDTVLREVGEETGYRIEVAALLGVDSVRLRLPRGFGRRRDHHAVRLLYTGRITGGELRPEVGGTTDLGAWHPLEEVPALHRVPLIDTALALWRTHPAPGPAAT